MKFKIQNFMVVILLIALLMTGCAKKVPTEPAKAEAAVLAEPQDPGVQQKVLAFNLEGLSDKGTKKWEVNGDSAEAISQDEIKLSNIVAKTYGEEAEATITADKGIYDKARNNVKLEENVKAVIENTEGFAAEHMDIAGGLTGNAGAGKGAPSKEKAKSKTVITCDGEAAFDYEKGAAYFDKNVKVISDDGDIIADKMTVNLDKDSKKIETIVAEGNVTIRQGENVTHSEKATYKEADKKVTLTGNPKIVLYQENGNGIGEKFLK